MNDVRQPTTNTYSKERGDKIINLQQDSLKDRVYNALMKMIKEKEFPSGKLPSEPKLSKDLGVSRSTLRDVLTLMEKEGLLLRKHGIGTFINFGINRLNINIHKPTKIFDIIENSGYKPSLLKENIEMIETNLLVKEKLNLTGKDNFLLIERVFGANKIPAVYVEEYIPRVFLENKKNINDLPVSIYTIAEECSTKDISFTFTDIIPHIAKGKLIEHLSCDKGDPILLMEETHLDNKSTPIMFSKVYTSDKFIRFQLLKSNPK